ncbi:MAG: carbohydrate-binding protein, partial [Bacteroidales bacterium]|nr:carbohydrate-binding protein [Bacteroidales bacterium]
AFTTLGDVDADEQTYTDNSVIDGTTYIYQVRALDNGMATTISNTPQVTTPNCLNDITDLSITDTACNMVVLNWTDNCTGESGFRVRRKILGESVYTTLEDVPADVESYTDNTVSAVVSYIYQVRVLNNGVAAGGSNNPQVTTPACMVDLHIEAENFINQSVIQTETTTDIGGGHNIGWIEHNDWAEYHVNIPQAGTYSMTFRVAGKKSADIIVESNGSPIGTASLSSTGGWQTWSTVGPLSVNLPAGQQTIKLTFVNTAISTPLVNVNWFEIYTPGLKSIDNKIMENTLADVNIYPNPSNGIFNVALESNELATLEIMNLAGTVVHSVVINNGQSTINASQLCQGVYMVKISTGNSSILHKLIIR